jgi:cell division protein ZapE
MVVKKVDGGVDYRLRALEQAEIYHCPLDDRADLSLAKSFARLTANSGVEHAVLELDGGRVLQTRYRADGVAWIDFNQLCGKPVGPADYLELAKCHRAVLLANIPQLGEHDDDCAKRFVTLIDTLYDRNVILICSAAVPPNELYVGKRLAQPFLRTVSRLVEMATHEYLAKEHLP